MILQATFDELNSLIGQKTPVKGLTLSYHAPDTATVTMVLHILGILHPSVSARVKIVYVDGSRITTELETGTFSGIILDKARKYLIEKTPAGLIEETGDKHILILNLDVLPELKTLFETVNVGGIAFTEQAVRIEASMK